MATTRTFTNLGISAFAADTVIPPSPIPGTAYRNTTVTPAENEVGEKFDTFPDSAFWNQQQFIITSFIESLDEHGIMGWSDLTDYTLPAWVWGSDDLFYQAIQASGPGGVGAKDPISEPTYWMELMDGGVPQQEITNIITNTGIVYDSGIPSQFMEALTRIAGGSIIYTETGNSLAYNLNLTSAFANNALTAYIDGMLVKFIAANQNTSSLTVEIGTLGAKAVVDVHGDALVGGEIGTTETTSMAYNAVGNHFVLLRDPSTAVAAARVTDPGGGGAPSLNGAFNASSVVRLGPVGEYQINFAHNLDFVLGAQEYEVMVFPDDPNGTILPYDAGLGAGDGKVFIYERGTNAATLADGSFHYRVVPIRR